MGNVVKLKLVDGVGDGARIEANKVLAGARQAKLIECTVIGTEPDGTFYLASTEGHAEVVMAMRFAEFWLFTSAMDDCG